MRHVTTYSEVDLAAAYDVMICCPTMNPDRMTV
jgi:hypothetical protein